MGPQRFKLTLRCDSTFTLKLVLLISITMVTRSFPGIKRLGHGIHHPPSSSAEFKERAELHIYSPSGPSRPIPGLTFNSCHLTTQPKAKLFPSQTHFPDTKIHNLY